MTLAAVPVGVLPINLDDTTHCPADPECAVCGEPGEVLPAIFKSSGPDCAPYCATICTWCAELGLMPDLTGPAENHAVVIHATEHCGAEP